MYEKFFTDGDINKILGAINELHSDVLCCCHGKYHAMQVVATTENILESLGFDARTVELGKIAAFLHDIGCIAGRWKHAEKSAALAGVFLSGADLWESERGMIVQAIADHSDGKNISSAVGAAVLIADKTDISRGRIFLREDIDEIHKNLLEVEKVDIKISDGRMTINYITTEKFSRDIFVNDFISYKKPWKLPKKAAKFLGLRCRFKINGEKVSFK